MCVEKRKAKAPSEQAQLVPAKNTLRSFPLCSAPTSAGGPAGEVAPFDFASWTEATSRG